MVSLAKGRRNRHYHLKHKDLFHIHIWLAWVPPLSSSLKDGTAPKYASVVRAARNSTFKVHIIVILAVNITWVN